MQAEVRKFDEMRTQVKEAKASKQLSNRLLTQYNQISVAMRDKLVAQLQKDAQALKRYQVLNQTSELSAYMKQLQHKINITHRVLAHEWKINTQALL